MTTAAFLTDEGVRVPAVSTEVMREIDRIAVEETGPNLYQMMENAGRSLALAVIERIGADWASTPIVVLAGTGGNGGGGICAARHLANRGADVTVVLTDPAALSPVSHEQLDTYRGTGGSLVPADDLDLLEPGFIVDAVIGYSLGGVPHGPARSLIEWMAARTAPVLSLDVPSGIDATSGQAAGSHVTAAATLTLALPKSGLDVAAVGDLILADIGIPAATYRRAGVDIPRALFGSAYRIAIRPS